MTIHNLKSDTPNGFQTVPGWWAEYWAGALDLLRDPIETFTTDSKKLMEMCEAEGLPFHWVKSPPAFGQTGAAKVAAFPIALLEEFYPANP